MALVMESFPLAFGSRFFIFTIINDNIHQQQAFYEYFNNA